MKPCLVKSDNQQGSILLITLMVLLILTTLGVTAISTMTTEVRMTGNAKVHRMVFYGADGGGRTYAPILSETIEGRAVPLKFVKPQGPVVDSENLKAEIFGFNPNDGLVDSPLNDPDLSLSLDPVAVGVDLDRVQERYLSGGAAEFAGGYDGIGTSAAGGNVGIYYQVDSIGQLGRSQVEVSHVYIHHVK